MTFDEALNRLVNKYGKYGFDRELLSLQLQDGVMNQGFSLNMTYNGLRMALGSATGREELFSVEPEKRNIFYFPNGISDLSS
jgi:hypothetical protein